MTRVAKGIAHAVVALTICGVVMLVGQSDAQAQSKADCTVFEIEASNPTPPPPAAQRVHKQLKLLARKLSKGPFKAWSKFVKLAKHSPVKLEQNIAKELKLAPGGKAKLSILLRGVTTAQKGMKDRLRLSLTIDDSKGKRVINTGTEQDSGDYFLIVDGRLKIPGGDYILAISCSTKP